MTTPTPHPRTISRWFAGGLLVLLAGCSGGPADQAVDGDPPPVPPPAPADGAAAEAGDPFGDAGLAEVRIKLTIPAAGIDETISITEQQVMAADGGFRLATCGPLNVPAGLVGGYAVAATDTATTGAVARFEIAAIDDVTGPGEYPAVGSLQGSNGDTFALDGTLTVDPGLRSGSFSLREPAGNPVTGSYECLTN